MWHHLRGLNRVFLFGPHKGILFPHMEIEGLGKTARQPTNYEMKMNLYFETQKIVVKLGELSNSQKNK